MGPGGIPLGTSSNVASWKQTRKKKLLCQFKTFLALSAYRLVAVWVEFNRWKQRLENGLVHSQDVAKGRVDGHDDGFLSFVDNSAPLAGVAIHPS